MSGLPELIMTHSVNTASYPINLEVQGQGFSQTKNSVLYIFKNFKCLKKFVKYKVINWYSFK